MLNQDVKTSALGRRRIVDLTELKADVCGFSRLTQRRPAEVAACFYQERHVSDAAVRTI